MAAVPRVPWAGALRLRREDPCELRRAWPWSPCSGQLEVPCTGPAGSLRAGSRAPRSVWRVVRLLPTGLVHATPRWARRSDWFKVFVSECLWVGVLDSMHPLT